MTGPQDREISPIIGAAVATRSSGVAGIARILSASVVLTSFLLGHGAFAQQQPDQQHKPVLAKHKERHHETRHTPSHPPTQQAMASPPAAPIPLTPRTVTEATGDWTTDNDRLADMRRQLERQQIRITELEVRAQAVAEVAPQMVASTATMARPLTDDVSRDQLKARIAALEAAATHSAAPLPEVVAVALPPAPPPKPVELTGWSLRAAMAGQAWVVSTTGANSNLVELDVGAVVPDIGPIKSIYQTKAGAWTVEIGDVDHPAWIGARPDGLSGADAGAGVVGNIAAR